MGRSERSSILEVFSERRMIRHCSESMMQSSLRKSMNLFVVFIDRWDSPSNCSVVALAVNFAVNTQQYTRSVDHEI